MQKETGWSLDYVLWGVPWLAIQIGIADSPRVRKGGKTKRTDSVEEIIDLFE